MSHGFFEALYALQMPLIVQQQSELKVWAQYLEAIGLLANIKFILIYILPAVATVDIFLYSRIIMTTALTEIVTVCMQWMMAEDRPFWWVYETTQYSAIARPSIDQTRSTCETSPGSPPTDVATVVAILYTVHQFFGRNRGFFVESAMYLVYGVVVAAVSLTKIYFASNFPHQCLVGIVIGYLVAKFMNSKMSHRFLRMTRWRALKLYLPFVSIPVLLYWLIYVTGNDPKWSIRIAFKWCEDPSYLNPETTQMFTLTRNFALLFALAMTSPLEKLYSTKGAFSFWMRYSFPVSLAHVLAAQYAVVNTPKNSGLIWYYSYTFVLFFALVFFLCNFIHRLRVHFDKN